MMFTTLMLALICIMSNFRFPHGLITRRVIHMTASASEIRSTPPVSRALLSKFNITTVLSDMDGTFLTSKHTSTDRTVKSVKRLMKAGYTFFPCTGRSRSSVGLALPREFIELYGKTLEDVPGVYLQGLIVFGTDGSVVYEETLKNDVIESATTFCEENGLELIAYCGEKIYTKKNCPLTVGITDLHDLMPLEFPEGLPRLITSGIKTNKLIVLEEDEKLIKMRPALEERLGKTATLTKAVPGMLEILPAGANKGKGVGKMLEYLGVDPKNVLALGDGENDMEMLELVECGVAMENGKPGLKKIAQAVALTNDEEGVAEVLDILIDLKKQ